MKWLELTADLWCLSNFSRPKVEIIGKNPIQSWGSIQTKSDVRRGGRANYRELGPRDFSSPTIKRPLNCGAQIDNPPGTNYIDRIGQGSVDA